MKEKIDFGFVVLHYQAVETTIECIETLRKLVDSSNFSIKIVVIDNCSPNGSGKVIEEKFADDTRIKVILADENLGFARGNNLGYSFLKDNFDVDFIIDINNDILIKQKDFLEKIAQIYAEKKFIVLGPDVYVPNQNIHQNPIRIEEFTIEEAEKTINLLKKQLRRYRFVYFKHKFAPLKDKIKKMMGKYKPIDRTVEHSPCILHGSCFIFSRDFIEKRDSAFNPCTFMFFEEYILNYEILRLFPEKENAMLYDPKIAVEHHHSVSSNSIFASNYKKSKWRDKNCLESLRKFVALFFYVQENIPNPM